MLNKMNRLTQQFENYKQSQELTLPTPTINNIRVENTTIENLIHICQDAILSLETFREDVSLEKLRKNQLHQMRRVRTAAHKSFKNIGQSINEHFHFNRKLTYLLTELQQIIDEIFKPLLKNPWFRDPSPSRDFLVNKRPFTDKRTLNEIISKIGYPVEYVPVYRVLNIKTIDFRGVILETSIGYFTQMCYDVLGSLYGKTDMNEEKLLDLLHQWDSKIRENPDIQFNSLSEFFGSQHILFMYVILKRDLLYLIDQVQLLDQTHNEYNTLLTNFYMENKDIIDLGKYRHDLNFKENNENEFDDEDDIPLHRGNETINRYDYEEEGDDDTDFEEEDETPNHSNLDFTNMHRAMEKLDLKRARNESEVDNGDVSPLHKLRKIEKLSRKRPRNLLEIDNDDTSHLHKSVKKSNDNDEQNNFQTYSKNENNADNFYHTSDQPHYAPNIEIFKGGVKQTKKHTQKHKKSRKSKKQQKKSQRNKVKQR